MSGPGKASFAVLAAAAAAAAGLAGAFNFTHKRRPPLPPEPTLHGQRAGPGLHGQDP